MERLGKLFGRRNCAVNAMLILITRKMIKKTRGGKQREDLSFLCKDYKTNSTISDSSRENPNGANPMEALGEEPAWGRTPSDMIRPARSAMRETGAGHGGLEGEGGKRLVSSADPGC